ncbi:MAG: hypothetical protein JNM43_20830 [Planctomycetaceae bacterium]|nr:hypothetical protein [Planctomycetaceae bacterium]
MRYWSVFKAMMTRPWVWLMLCIGSFQGILLTNAVLNPQLNRFAECSPAASMPETTIDSIQAWTPLMLNDQLSTIAGFNTTNIPDNILFPRGVPSGSSQSEALNVLQQMPDLEGLILRPGTVLSSTNIDDLNRLPKLRSLTLVANSLADRNDAERLLRLPHLEELYAQGLSGTSSGSIPKMSRLKVLSADVSTFQVDWLSTLGTQCPQLETLILRTYADFEPSQKQIAALEEHPSLKAIYLASFDSPSTERQLDSLRASLPGLTIQRGVYWTRRIHVCGFLALVCMFFPLVFWVQSSLMMSLPHAMLMPRYRTPHLFWPVLVVTIMIVLYVGVATYYGVNPVSAILIGLLATTSAANGVPGYDLTEVRRQITRWMQKFDVVITLGIIGLFVLSPSSAEGFLMGDHRSILSVVLGLSILSFAWKLIRVSSLSRIVAESGIGGIPGLEMTNTNTFGQNLKPANVGFFGRFQMKRREQGVDKVIATMDRNDKVAMYRAAAPGTGIQVLVMLIVLVMIVASASVGARAVSLNFKVQRSQLIPLLIPFASWALVFLMSMAAIQWLLRRSMVSGEFLRPFGRSEFFWTLRMAIFHDLKYYFGIFWLAILIGPCYAESQYPGVITLVLSIIGASGAFAWVHGWLLLSVIGKRLWLHSSIGSLTGMLIIVLAAVSSGTSVSPKESLIAPIISGIVVAAAGAVLQWIIHRKLDRWELA